MADETEKKYYWLTYQTQSYHPTPATNVRGLAVDTHPLDWIMREKSNLERNYAPSMMPRSPQAAYASLRSRGGHAGGFVHFQTNAIVTLLSWQEITLHEYELARAYHMADYPPDAPSPVDAPYR